MDRGDYESAAQAFLKGSQLPNAHPGLKILAGRMAQKAGDLETARMMWGVTYDTAGVASIKENAALHLIAIQVAEDVTGLEKIVEMYRAQTGRLPSGFRDLAAVNTLAGIPADPYGEAYVLNPDGTVVVRHPDKFRFLMKGLPKGYTPPVTARD